MGYFLLSLQHHSNMKKMKKSFLTLGMLVAMGTNLLAEDFGYLVFSLNDGTMQGIVARDLTLRFNDGKLIATSGTNTLNIPLESLKSMAFSYDDVTGISQLNNNAQWDSSAEICDLQGRKVSREQMKPGNIYVVKYNNKTIKTVVK